MRKIIMFLGVILAACQSNHQNLNNELPAKLEGVQIQYTYAKGNEYAVKFEDEGLSYQYRSGGAPEKWWGPFDYNHLITENKEHYVSWFEPGYGDYVTLLVNFDTKVLYGSAIIKGKHIHFQKAKIHSIKTP